jgi:hypothetical protein
MSEFDYSKLVDQVVLPEAQLNFNGSDFMKLLNMTRGYLSDNTSPVYDAKGSIVGNSLASYARPVQDLHSYLYHVMLKRFFLEGDTLSLEDLQKELQKRSIEAQVKSEEVPVELTVVGEVEE